MMQQDHAAAVCTGQWRLAPLGNSHRPRRHGGSQLRLLLAIMPTVLLALAVQQQAQIAARPRPGAQHAYLHALSHCRADSMYTW